jgi:flagellar protein FlbT
MTKAIQLSLKAGERIFINGAVVRVQRKVTIELLNDATFLLEGHVMQVEETTTPLRQLYFVAQTMLMDPRNADESRKLFEHLHARAVGVFRNESILSALRTIANLIAGERTFEALRAIRGLFPLEDTILTTQPARAA